MTLGYDGSLMNGLEAIESWNECKFTLISALAAEEAHRVSQLITTRVGPPSVS
jgi:hypothetical protein